MLLERVVLNYLCHLFSVLTVTLLVGSASTQQGDGQTGKQKAKQPTGSIIMPSHYATRLWHRMLRDPADSSAE